MEKIINRGLIKENWPKYLIKVFIMKKLFSVSQKTQEKIIRKWKRRGWQATKPQNSNVKYKYQKGLEME